VPEMMWDRALMSIAELRTTSGIELLIQQGRRQKNGHEYTLAAEILFPWISVIQQEIAYKQ
jgi:hypothetical protein